MDDLAGSLAPLPFETRLAPLGQALDAAAVWARASWERSEFRSYRARTWEELMEGKEVDPVALANQYVFAMQGEGSESDHPGVKIVPLAFWRDNGCCSDRPAPVAASMPAGFSRRGPGKSGGSSGRPDWLFEPGLAPHERAAQMLDAGFHWLPDFQKFVDWASRSDGLSMMGVIVEAREIARAAREPEPVSAPAKRPGL